MDDENTPMKSLLGSILGTIVFIFVIIEVVIFLLMGGSSVATEPTPIFGNYFSIVVILVIVAIAVFFVGIAKRSEKRAENVRESNS
jgi:hypothetical protein